MSRENFLGWKQVFLFSFKEGIREKSYRGLLITFCAILLVSAPIMTFVKNNGSKKDANSSISVVLVYDATGMQISYQDALAGGRYQNTAVIGQPEDGFEEKLQELEKAEGSTEVAVRLAYDANGYFDMTVAHAKGSGISEEDLNMACEDLKQYFQKARLQALHVSKEQADYLNQSVESSVEFLTEDGKLSQEESSGISYQEYMVMLVGIMVVTMFISFSGTQVATAVVTEKSTKVIEYLILHVKPLALLIGKVLAVFLLVLIQFACMGASYLLSVVLNSAIWRGQAQNPADAFSDFTSCLVAASPATILLSLLVILAGVLFYCIFAGLIGASVSKMEEMTEGMKMFQFIMIVGAYLSIGLCIAEMAGGANVLLENLCIFLPLSTPFIVPAMLLMGKASVAAGLASLAILFAAIVLLFLFTAKVYGTMILYQGKTLKVKQIIGIAQNKEIK